MRRMGWNSVHHENDSQRDPNPSSRSPDVAGSRFIGHHPPVDTKTRLVVVIVFLLVVSLFVIAGLIAFANPAK
jgi:hypothetical protein